LVLIAWAVMPTQEKHMQKFIKSLQIIIRLLVACTYLVLVLPFAIAGFIYESAADAFKAGRMLDINDWLRDV
jgi:hypothetical protein